MPPVVTLPPLAALRSRGRGLRWAGLVVMAVTVLWSLAAILRPFEPPLVSWDAREVPERPSTALLPEAQLVELASEGRVLRGYFVASDPGAPVVLHLVGSGLSVLDPGWGMSSGIFSVGLGQLSWGVRRLADAGFASLAVDYTGVGRSDGSRSTAEFLADVRVMWEEAVRRAGGDPERVVIRGTSLGALGAAALLADGARPRALLLHTPVLAETVVEHFARGLMPESLVGFVTPLMARAPRIDLRAALRDSGVPTHLYLEVHDELLPPDEARSLGEAVSAVPGSSLVERDITREWSFGFIKGERFAHHAASAMRSGVLLQDEAPAILSLGATVETAWRVARVLERTEPALRAAFLADADADDARRARLEALCGARLFAHPDLLVAAALARADPQLVELLDDDWPSLLPGFLRGRTPTEQVALLDLADPAGALPPDLFVELVESLWGADELRGRAMTPLDDEHARALWLGLARTTPGPRGPSVHALDASGERTGLGTPRDVMDRIWAHLLDAACRQHADGEANVLAQLSAARRAQRLALKACGLPDRLATPGSVVSTIEARVGDAWIEIPHDDVFRAPPQPEPITRFLLDDARDPYVALTQPWWVAHRLR